MTEPKRPRSKAPTFDREAEEPAVATYGDSEGEGEGREGDEAPLDEDALQAELVDGAEVPDLSQPIVVHRGGRAKAGLLARYDPLEAYMRDVQRYKLLTPEEEREAAVKYYEEGDLEAAARLVTANLRLVVKLAYEYRRAHRHIPDLIQEGSIGLMQAVRKYDPYKGVKLSTYAAWWIRAYMLRFILNNARLVKLGTTQAQRKLFFNLRKEKAKLSALGIEPTAEVIAERLHVTADEVTQMDRRLSAGDLSLDAPVRATEDASPSRVDLLAWQGARADDLLADSQIHELMSGKLVEYGRTLTGKDARLFEARMLADDPLTLQQLGEEFGVSRERVRQLEKRLQMRLKEYLARELGDDAVEAD